MKSPRDFLYGLLKARHSERWHRFGRFAALGNLRIVMYVVSHSNRAKARDIIADLIDAGDSRNPETLAREIRYLKTDRILKEDREGFLSLENPMHFIIKESRRGLSDVWFWFALATSISASVINFAEHGFGTVEFFLLFITALIFLKVVDDLLHETTW